MMRFPCCVCRYHASTSEGRGAPAACADLIRADPALVPMIESLAVRGQFCIRC